MWPHFKTKNKFQWHTSIDEIPREEWNALAHPLPTPFLEWEWLHSLEKAGTVTPRNGWQPVHLSMRRGNKLVAAAALYLKGHSRGEFVFDQNWAEAAAQLGIHYYPKMLGMSPFTPAPGYRFLVAPDEDEKQSCQLLLKEIHHFCDAQGICGLHFLHTDPQWAQLMIEAGMSPWLHHHLVWENHHYENFDAYLDQFKSKQRKNIKRERRIIRDQRISCSMIPGTDASQDLYRFMYALYGDTCQKFWNWSRYLNEAFFMELSQSFAHRILLSASQEDERGGLPLAMSFLIRKGDIIHGRYWGCREQYDNLHFETCYYQPIEWCIQNGIRFFDAGSGNARHKQKRGFPARPNQSLHYHYHPTMKKIWDTNIPNINALEQQQIDAINREYDPKKYYGN